MEPKLLITSYYNQIVEIAKQYLAQYINTDLAQYTLIVDADNFNLNTEPYYVISDQVLPDIFVSLYDYKRNRIFSATISDHLEINDQRPAQDLDLEIYLQNIHQLLNAWYHKDYQEITNQYTKYLGWYNRCLQHLYQVQNQLNKTIIKKDLMNQVSTEMLVDESGPLLMLKSCDKKEHAYLQAIVTMDIYGSIDYPEIDIDENAMKEIDVDEWLKKLDLTETIDASALSQLRATELVKL